YGKFPPHWLGLLDRLITWTDAPQHAIRRFATPLEKPRGAFNGSGAVRRAIRLYLAALILSGAGSSASAETADSILANKKRQNAPSVPPAVEYVPRPSDAAKKSLLPSTKGQYVPRPSDAAKKILTCAPQQCINHRLYNCKVAPHSPRCACNRRPVG